MRERSDETLMKAYAKGSIEAFGLLYNRHRGPFYRYFLRLAGDAATANDLYQGSWEKIIKARETYNPSVPFQPWIYRIGHNHAMDHFRRLKPQSDQLPDTIETGDAGPEEHLLQAGKTAGLRDAISRLPIEQKETLLLKLDAGLDLQSIADITGVNRETAKSRLRYAVDKLKSELGEA
jgi:RNA polymerase sigma-70 factor (ECF subfamily)